MQDRYESVFSLFRNVTVTVVSSPNVFRDIQEC
jgi:hypothetical protein